MKKWIKLIIVIATFAAVSTILYILLNSLGLTNLSLIKSSILASGHWGIIIYVLILIFALVLFCFVPFLNTALVVLGIALFGAKVTFFTSLIAIFFSTTILFYIGDKLGENFAAKLVGKKALEDTQNLIDHKSKFWLPIFFIIPAIPDEALCLVAGMTKMKYWYVLLVSLIYHAVEIGVFCFLGSGLISWHTLSILDWAILINLVFVDIYLLLKLEKFLKNSKKTEK